jgi:CDP-4-dehydro-6-deoxyglucose reductase, E3
MIPPPTFEARLVRARTLTPSVRELTFERVDGQPMSLEPGQWVSVALPVAAPAATSIRRSYSVASAPDGSPRFEIALTRVPGGPGSTWLTSLEPGPVLQFIGPQGFFTRAASSPAPSLLIATGTGVTPMRSMMRAAIGAGSRAPMWLLFGVRQEDDLVYRDEFEDMARSHDFVRFEPTLSRPHEGWGGRSGYVQTHVRALWAELESLGAGAPHAYICGLERMVGSVRELLRKDMGLPRQQVHGERYD